MFAMDLGQRFALEESFADSLYRMQNLLLDTLETESELTNWCEAYGIEWLRSLQRAVAIYRQWEVDWGTPSASTHKVWQTYYQMQQLLVDCLRHNRTFPAHTVQRFEQCLLVREVQHELA